MAKYEKSPKPKVRLVAHLFSRLLWPSRSHFHGFQTQLAQESRRFFPFPNPFNASLGRKHQPCSLHGRSINDFPAKQALRRLNVCREVTNVNSRGRQLGRVGTRNRGQLSRAVRFFLQRSLASKASDPVYPGKTVLVLKRVLLLWKTEPSYPSKSIFWLA